MMKLYWIKTSGLVKKIFNTLVWHVPNKEKKIYLTFDDGPTPTITEWVLNVLNKNNIKATFFCIGANIDKHPDIFKKIVLDGHAVGNHTFNHVNGWQTTLEEYIKNTALCQESIIKNKLVYNMKSEINSGKIKKESTIFRPPYGKIKRNQAKLLRQLGYKIIMWDLLSADFDQNVSVEKCLENATKKVTSGSIIVFHDSLKAYKNLEYALPKAIEILKNKGFSFDVIR
jgi:peptidoglycan-N-acetylglucosamine deacetylase